MSAFVFALLTVAVAYLWRRLRALERRPPSAASIDADIDRRMRVLEQAERRRDLAEYNHN